MVAGGGASLRRALLAAVLWAMCLQAGAAPKSLEETLRLPDETPGPGAAFAIFLTGDGGWAELDREVARRLAAADLPVVGWDSRAYYWTRRTPEEAAGDLDRVIARFRAAWNRPGVVLVGYSRGADVLPFLVNRLPDATRAGVRLVACLGLGREIDFEFHLTDFLSDTPPASALPVVPEVQRMRGSPLLVVFGEKDDATCAATLPADVGRIERVPGDHHFARDYDRLAKLILDEARPAPADAPTQSAPASGASAAR